MSTHEDSKHCCHAPPPATTGPTAAVAAPTPAGKYICPMCPGVVEDRPVPCPRCGMALEKVPEPAFGRPTQYTCPMHPEIRQDRPGNCPICGMALEAVAAPAEGLAEDPEESRWGWAARLPARL